jgi:hypothetical protein
MYRYNYIIVRVAAFLPGENWTLTTSEIRTVESYDGNRSRINVTTTDRLVNYGLLNKKDIEKNMGW